MRFNPTKCTFDVASEIQAILDMVAPKTFKDVENLMGQMTVLARFISKTIDRCTPFFKALKSTKWNIVWTLECEKNFAELKKYMSEATLLSTHEAGATLLVYFSVSFTVVQFHLPPSC